MLGDVVQTAPSKRHESVQLGNSGYRLSFTTGGLLLPESVRVAGEYARLLDWPATVEHARSQNLLQARTASSGDRVLREVCSRLRC